MDSDLQVREATYSTAARHFHWWTVALLAIQVPVGLYMAYRGNVRRTLGRRSPTPSTARTRRWGS